MAWPNIPAPSYTTGGETYLSQVRTEFEGGYAQSRKPNSRETRRWTLHWNNLEEAHFLALEAAFIADQGNEFSWTEPVRGIVYQVRYSEDSLRWSHTDKGFRQVSVGLEEV